MHHDLHTPIWNTTAKDRKSSRLSEIGTGPNAANEVGHVEKKRNMQQINVRNQYGAIYMCKMGTSFRAVVRLRMQIVQEFWGYTVQ
jgi:hypothetical protein